MRLLALLLAVPSLALAQARAQTRAPAPTAAPSTPRTSAPDQVVGAAVAPAALPAGTTSVYALLGAPELLAGFRQGLGPVETEARLRLDYLRVAAAVEGLLRVPVYRAGTLTVAPTLGLGFVANSGATYFDAQNFSGTFLRVLPGAVLSTQVADTLSLVAALDVPVDIPLRKEGGSRVAALAGGGAEVYVGEGLSLVGLGQLGAESLRAPGVTAPTWRVAWRLQVGMGLRLF